MRKAFITLVLGVLIVGAVVVAPKIPVTKKYISKAYRNLYTQIETEHTKYIRSLGNNVVMITGAAGGGTGSYVKFNGKVYILTNAHICRLATNSVLKIQPEDQDPYIAGVIKIYPLHDLCVIDAVIDHSALTISTEYEFGETVYAIGHPYLEPLSVTSGEFSGLAKTQIIESYNVTEKECSGPTYKLYQASQINNMYVLFGIYTICVRELVAYGGTIPILPGNSGSPVLNNKGQIVGVIYAANEYGTRSYTVPLEDVYDFLESL